LLLRCFGKVSLRTLRRHPHGIRLGALRVGDLRARLRTPGRKIRLAPREILDLLARDADSKIVRDPAHPFLLLSRRRRGAMNSWLNHLPSSKRADGPPWIELAPADADRLGAADGARVRIVNPCGSFVGVAKRSSRCLEGTVTAPHSYTLNLEGEDRTCDGLGMAQTTLNNLINDTDLEPLTGMPRFHGTSVRVELALEDAAYYR
jgi:formate dehydrogenase